jgi:mono/diheme cytochrome c family protein
MKRLVITMLLITVVVVLVLSLAARPASLQAGALPQHEPDPANGQRMFHAGGCASCHSSVSGDSVPPLLGGGLEMETPFGLFRVPNISPHPSSGIGDWSMLDFVNAMLLGVSPDKRHYYPAFPYTSYSRMSFQDLMDLKAYLDTLPVVDKASAGHSLKFPWNIRAGIGLWKLLNLDSSFVTPGSSENNLLERGRYLVEGPGHCGECHTPRNWMGGLDMTRWLAGAPNPEGEGRVPNITPHKDGLSGWDEGDIEYYLASGFTPDFDTVGGSMVKVQENMALLSAEDRAAIAAYLKSVQPLD